MGIKKIDCCVSKPKEKPYPKLTKGSISGNIYLSVDVNKHTVLALGHDPGISKIGEVYSHPDVKDYNEPLTLQNE